MHFLKQLQLSCSRAVDLVLFMVVIHRVRVNLRGYAARAAKSFINAVGLVLFQPLLIHSTRNQEFASDLSFKILYVTVAFRGDLLLNFPAINAIKRTFPRAEIHCWVNEYNIDLAEANCNITKVIGATPPALGLFKSLRYGLTNCDLFETLSLIRSEKYDLYLDDSGTAITAIAGWRSKIPFRVGRNGQGLGFLNHKSVSFEFDSNLTSKRLSLLRHLGITAYQESDYSATNISLPDEINDVVSGKLGTDVTGEGYYTVQVFAGWAAKEWNTAKMASVLNQFSSKSALTPVLIGGEADCAKLKTFSESLTVGFVVAAGKLTLLETLALIKNARLHFGVDSVGSHIAALFGTKCVTIYGPTNPLKIARLSKDNLAIYARSSCTPKNGHIYCCYDAGRSCKKRHCMERLNSESVLEVLFLALEDRAEKTVYEY